MHLQDEADDSELRGGNEFRYYGALDVTKLLMAALVVAIHTHPFDDLADPIIVRAATGLTSVAVPFFFIASGFLCFRKIEINHVQSRASMKRIGATIQRLLRLYIIWTAVFLPVTVLGSILEGRAVWKSALLFLRGFLLVGENFCSWPLWYLLASAVSFSLIYCLIKRGLKPSAILLFSYLCLLFGFALTWLNGSDYLPAPLHDAVNLYFILFLNVRNGLFEGFFYVSLGMALGFYEKRIIRGGMAPDDSVDCRLCIDRRLVFRRPSSAVRDIRPGELFACRKSAGISAF